MSHNITISDEIWQWAVANTPGDGPATHLRNVIMAEIIRQQGRGVASREAPSNSGGRGKAIHQACYEKLVDNYGDGAETPSATALQAQFSNICQCCKKVINAGDSIVMTNLEEWR
jgi:hypothetical protein